MTDERRDACRAILQALMNRLMLMSIPDRARVTELATRFDIKAVELLEVLYNANTRI